MKRKWFYMSLVLFLLITAGCDGGSPANQAGVSPSPPPPSPAKASARTGTYFDILEVGLGPNGYVSLTNFTSASASLAGLYLCQGSQCFELPDVDVAPGETARIAIGDGTGLEGVVATGATLGGLRPSDGEIALYASPDIKDPEEMLNYLQWGSTPHELTQVAVEAGLWLETGYAPTSQNATRLFRVKESGLWLFDEP